MADRTILITGAGSGLGRALAREAAGRGWIVIASGRDPAALVETGVGLDPTRYWIEIVDVADFVALDAAAHRVQERFGRIDALIANAAVYPRISLLDQQPEAWMSVLATNVGGVMASMRAVLPTMMAEARGRILAVGSFADLAPIPDSSAYAVSKGALHALVKAVNAELAGDFPDILVNEWIPGALNTRMGIAEGFDPAEAARWGMDLIELPSGSPSGRIYDRDRLVELPRSVKQRLVDKLLRRSE